MGAGGAGPPPPPPMMPMGGGDGGDAGSGRGGLLAAIQGGASLKKTEGPNASKPAVADDDGRGGLLAAIRGASKGGLRKVSEEEKKAPRNESVGASSGLAGIGLALAAALDTRRKDMVEGAASDEEEDDDDDDWGDSDDDDSD